MAYRNGERVYTSIFEAAAWHQRVQASCRRPGCQHSGTFDPHQLWWLFYRKRWDDELREAWKRFRCTKCRARGARLCLDRNLEPTIKLAWPDQAEWRRALSRYRG